MGKTVVIDVSNFFPPLPVEREAKRRFLEKGGYLFFPAPSGTFSRLCQLHARFDRVVFFAQDWDDAFVRIHLIRWLKKQGLLTPGQESNVVVFRTPQKGIWCREHEVSAYVSDQWQHATADVFRQSPQTLCCFLSSGKVVESFVHQLWDSETALSAGQICATPTWADVFGLFPA